jgi:hypothetical protein
LCCKCSKAATNIEGILEKTGKLLSKVKVEAQWVGVP